jgi:RNA polymerase sigma factor (sigma-70 family)
MHAARDGEQKLLREAKHGDSRAREQVIREYDGLLRWTASRYRGLGLPLEDVVQEGAIGLLEAIDSFDATRGASFETFARWHIRHAITDALTAQGRLVRLPKQIVERRRAITRTASELTAKNGQAPTAAEITAETGLPIASVEAIQALPKTPASLDERLARGDDTVLELIEDPTATDPEAEALALHRSEVIAEALERLPDRQRKVIECRFGFGHSPMSLVELSRELHLCPQRTRAIEQAAIYRLAKMLEGDPTFQLEPGPSRTCGVSRRRVSGTRHPRRRAGPSPPCGPTRTAGRPPARARGTSTSTSVARMAAACDG